MTVTVLGIDVDDELVTRWRGWLMPERQPFVVPMALARQRGWADDRAALAFELVDTFELYAVMPDQAIVLLDRATVQELPAEVRRAQPAPHRWPTSDTAADTTRTLRYMERGRVLSRHREVTEVQWRDAAALAGARSLAGTFVGGSGPNCFGAVMAAAGIPGAAEEWMQLPPFEDWLAASTRPGGRDEDAGTVLLWRDTDGAPAHSAVTLGNGWVLNKASQGWMSPVQVLAVRNVISRSRFRGLRLERRLLV
ncbi:hypothetical protein PU630_00770 [Microbacterium horticulturae]|uniref:NlpC/P60 family protein n=1 Tax=Microbacterium horticulturae TaxID=3028316 RepID=A0ABY8C1A1_9MICO|nr:hypothetical protein [Microbacterium sp. KACC 23027]WEG09127.1 hypothetical protein PU630_00770 [Microbacterium sp. KACC 23027]